MKAFAIIALFWAACGWVGFRMTLFYFQTRWPTLADKQYRDDVLFAFQTAALGPAGLIAAMLHGGRVPIYWVPPPGHPARAPFFELHRNRTHRYG